MYSRGEEHLTALSKRSEGSVLWNHCIKAHGKQETTFRMKASGYFTDPLTRQIDEAVRIHNSPNLMNRKGEWKKAAVPQPLYIRE